MHKNPQFPNDKGVQFYWSALGGMQMNNPLATAIIKAPIIRKPSWAERRRDELVGILVRRKLRMLAIVRWTLCLLASAAIIIGMICLVFVLHKYVRNQFTPIIMGWAFAQLVILVWMLIWDKFDPFTVTVKHKGKTYRR